MFRPHYFSERFASDSLSTDGHVCPRFEPQSPMPILLGQDREMTGSWAGRDGGTGRRLLRPLGFISMTRPNSYVQIVCSSFAVTTWPLIQALCDFKFSANNPEILCKTILTLLLLSLPYIIIALTRRRHASSNTGYAKKKSGESHAEIIGGVDPGFVQASKTTRETREKVSSRVPLRASIKFRSSSR